MKKPTFLFIGPDKTGSSWLYDILRQHPRCFVPAVKDLYFFDRYYERGLAWYCRYFEDAPADALAIGELSHDYLFSPLAADRIAADLPGVTLLTSLRDPVERSFSHYLYMIRSGRTRLSFEDALRTFPELVDNSLYGRHLAEYARRFSAQQLHVLMFEDLVADSRRFARAVFDALGLPFVEDLDYARHVLPASRPRSFALARLAKLGAVAARDLGLAALVGRVKHSRLAQTLYVSYGRDDKPRIAPETARALRLTFAPDIERLQALVGRNLASWLPGVEQAS